MKTFKIFCLLILFPVLLITGFAAAEDENSNEGNECDAFVVDVVGKCDADEAGDEEEWFELEKDMCLYPGDRIRSGKDSVASLQFAENRMVRCRLHGGGQKVCGGVLHHRRDVVPLLA